MPCATGVVMVTTVPDVAAWATEPPGLALPPLEGNADRPADVA